MKQFFDFKNIKVTDVLLAVLFVANLWLNGKFVPRADYEAQRGIITNLEKTISVMQVTLNRVDDHEARIRILENGRLKGAEAWTNTPFYYADFYGSTRPVLLLDRVERSGITP